MHLPLVLDERCLLELMSRRVKLVLETDTLCDRRICCSMRLGINRDELRCCWFKRSQHEQAKARGEKTTDWTRLCLASELESAKGRPH